SLGESFPSRGQKTGVVLPAEVYQLRTRLARMGPIQAVRRPLNFLMSGSIRALAPRLPATTLAACCARIPGGSHGSLPRRVYKRHNELSDDAACWTPIYDRLIRLRFSSDRSTAGRRAADPLRDLPRYEG